MWTYMWIKRGLRCGLGSGLRRAVQFNLCRYSLGAGWRALENASSPPALCRRLHRLSTGRGLHSSTSQLNMSPFFSSKLELQSAFQLNMSRFSYSYQLI